MDSFQKIDQRKNLRTHTINTKYNPKKNGCRAPKKKIRINKITCKTTFNPLFTKTKLGLTEKEVTPRSIENKGDRPKITKKSKHEYCELD